MVVSENLLQSSLETAVSYAAVDWNATLPSPSSTPSRPQRVPFGFRKRFQYRSMLIWVCDYNDVCMVLCRRSYHRRSTNINHLNQFCSLAGGLAQRFLRKDTGLRIPSQLTHIPFPPVFPYPVSNHASKYPSWTAGCRVLTLPSNISGCPVASDTSLTSIPESLSLVAVPPVDRIVQPMDCNDAASSSIPVLSQTLISAVGRSMGTRV